MRSRSQTSCPRRVPTVLQDDKFASETQSGSGLKRERNVEIIRSLLDLPTRMFDQASTLSHLALASLNVDLVQTSWIELSRVMEV